MLKYVKAVVFVCCLILVTGCTANNTRSAVFDFFQSTHEHYEKRQLRKAGQLSKSDKNYKKEDAAVGIVNAVLNVAFRGVTGQSDDN